MGWYGMGCVEESVFEVVGVRVRDGGGCLRVCVCVRVFFVVFLFLGALGVVEDQDRAWVGLVVAMTSLPECYPRKRQGKEATRGNSDSESQPQGPIAARAFLSSPALGCTMFGYTPLA